VCSPRCQGRRGLAAGADIVGAEDLVETVQKGAINSTAASLGWT
jgi:hypothetical protein